MKEIWKDIPNYEGYYQASNLGRIKSLERIVKHNCGGPKKLKERIFKGYVNRYGYVRIELSKQGKSKQFSAHRIVALTFLGPSDLAVNHIDGVKTNNNIENLEYVTLQENITHAVEIGLIKNNSKINAKSIVEDYKNGFRLRELERKYKTSHHDISKVLKSNNVETESKGLRRRRYKIDELEIKQLVEKGLNDSEISRVLNVSRYAVRYRRKLMELAEVQNIE